ncbi:MAG TPA: ABC transporter substrate-binding protein [Bacteroidota bacterium]
MRSTLVLAALILVLLLSAGSCRARSGDTKGIVTITFWHSFVASTVPALNDLIRRFEEEHPSIHIKAQYVPTGDGLIQKLVSAVQSSTAPDVSWIHSDFIDKLVAADAIYPMKVFIDGPDGMSDEEIKDINPGCLEAGKWRNALYALPMEGTSLALIYNRGLFRKAGLDPNAPPRNWSELCTYTRKLTVDFDNDGTMDQYGFHVPVFPASGELNIWMVLQWTPFLWQAGGQEFDTARTKSMFNSEAGVQALALWKKLYDEQDFSRFGIAHDIGFASGKLAMVMDGPWNLPRYRAMKDIDWAVAPLPAGPVRRATYLAGELLAIFKQSEHPKEAWTFVKWILEPRIQAMFSTKSGYLPVRMSVQGMKEYTDFLSSDPALETYVRQMKSGEPRVQLDAHRVEVNRVLAEAIERATLGRMDPSKCLDEAAAKADQYLNE